MTTATATKTTKSFPESCIDVVDLPKAISTFLAMEAAKVAAPYSGTLEIRGSNAGREVLDFYTDFMGNTTCERVVSFSSLKARPVVKENLSTGWEIWMKTPKGWSNLTTTN